MNESPWPRDSLRHGLSFLMKVTFYFLFQVDVPRAAATMLACLPNTPLSIRVYGTEMESCQSETDTNSLSCNGSSDDMEVRYGSIFFYFLL
jgi:hypothetical protein